MATKRCHVTSYQMSICKMSVALLSPDGAVGGSPHLHGCFRCLTTPTLLSTVSVNLVITRKQHKEGVNFTI